MFTKENADYNSKLTIELIILLSALVYLIFFKSVYAYLQYLSNTFLCIMNRTVRFKLMHYVPEPGGICYQQTDTLIWTYTFSQMCSFFKDPPYRNVFDAIYPFFIYYSNICFLKIFSRGRLVFNIVFAFLELVQFVCIKRIWSHLFCIFTCHMQKVDTVLNYNKILPINCAVVM